MEEKGSPKGAGSGNDGFSDWNQIVSSIIPSLSFDKHKGQAGRIGVVGGCSEYTGAPYFAAISALKTGADLAYVFCTSSAAPIIKSYSPELIVYPHLDSRNAVEKISAQFHRLHSLVIGPGLGRDDHLLTTMGGLIEKAKEMDLNLVLDADALFFINSCPELIRGYSKCVITPNAMEFDRLYSAVYGSDATKGKEQSSEKAVEQLSKTLGHVTICRKGPQDIISDGNNTVSCNEANSPRRCGGQGDLLSGAASAFSFWSHQAFSGPCGQILSSQKLTPGIVACLGACLLARRCNRLAFAKHGRSTTTSDMIKEIHKSFTSLFPVD